MATPLNDSAIIHRLHRRVGLGLRDGELGRLTSVAVRTQADGLLDAPLAADPWGDTDHTVGFDASRGERRRLTSLAISTWIDAMAATDQPLGERLAWFWHGHFVSAVPQAKNPQLMVDQMRLFRSAGRGAFGELVRAVTVDPAMLRYLDGDGSSGEAPNENYSRELLELFTVGQGPGSEGAATYGEADVAAGARALSGWRVRRDTSVAELVDRRHDDAPQHYLGVDGVHDVDTVVTAIERHPGLAPFVAKQLAREIIGPAVDAVTLAETAAAFVDSGHDVDALLRVLVEQLVRGVDGGEIIAPPVPWFVAARRATGATPAWRDVAPHLLAAGQTPWLPPNVSGWPSGEAWNNAATLVARFHLARLVAESTSLDAGALVAPDDESLATALGLTTAWSSSTRQALDSVVDARDRLTLALVSPEFVRC